MTPGVCKLLGALALVGAWPAPAFAADPVVSVWYRGSPAGVPQQDDLAVIRALGFTGVTWPAGGPGAVADVRRMAELVGLALLVRSEPRSPADLPAAPSTGRIDVLVAALAPEQLSAIVWRAVAHGAREISFDPGAREGTGLADRSGRPRPWVPRAVALARQLSSNAALVARLRPGPAVRVEPSGSAALDVVLLDADRSWVIIATNTSRATRKGTVHLPPAVPYALWVSWLDGSTMSMLNQPTGARWGFELEGGGARVYLIDKRLK